MRVERVVFVIEKQLYALRVKEKGSVSLNTNGNLKYEIKFSTILSKELSIVEKLLGQVKYAPLLQALNDEAGAYISIYASFRQCYSLSRIIQVRIDI